mgnify:CR=1 FL=1
MKGRYLYVLLPVSPRPGSNALRVDILEASPRCALPRKTDASGRACRPVNYVMLKGSSV